MPEAVEMLRNPMSSGEESSAVVMSVMDPANVRAWPFYGSIAALSALGAFAPLLWGLRRIERLEL